MSAEDAMKNYINELTRINGNWEQCIGIEKTLDEVVMITFFVILRT